MSSPQNPSGPQEPPYGQSGGQPPYGQPDPNFGPPGGRPNFGPPPGQNPYGPPGGDPNGPPYGAPPRQGMSTGAKVGIGVGGGCLVILVVIVVIGFLIGWGASSGSDTVTPPPAAEPSASAEEEAEAPTEEEAEPETADSGVTMTASNAGTAGDVLDAEAVYTVIDVTIENGSDEGVDVNPLYINAILADGSSVNDWGDALFADIDQIESGTLAPGDSTSGQIALVGEVEVTQVELQTVLGSNEPVAVAEVS